MLSLKPPPFFCPASLRFLPGSFCVILLSSLPSLSKPLSFTGYYTETQLMATQCLWQLSAPPRPSQRPRLLSPPPPPPHEVPPAVPLSSLLPCLSRNSAFKALIPPLSPAGKQLPSPPSSRPRPVPSLSLSREALLEGRVLFSGLSLFFLSFFRPFYQNGGMYTGAASPPS